MIPAIVNATQEMFSDFTHSSAQVYVVQIKFGISPEVLFQQLITHVDNPVFWDDCKTQTNRFKPSILLLH